jgi:hypothetical protein
MICAAWLKRILITYMLKLVLFLFLFNLFYLIFNLFYLILFIFNFSEAKLRRELSLISLNQNGRFGRSLIITIHISYLCKKDNYL